MTGEGAGPTQSQGMTGEGAGPPHPCRLHVPRTGRPRSRDGACPGVRVGEQGRIGARSVVARGRRRC